MGIRDRDYMREQPDEEAYEKYEKEAFDAEYGPVAGRQKRAVKLLVIAFLVVGLLLVVAAFLTAR